MAPDGHRLIDVVLDEATLVRRSPEGEHERAVAIFDLLEENDFGLVGGAEGGGGPYDGSPHDGSPDPLTGFRLVREMDGAG